jgi:hypothetical protein
MRADDGASRVSLMETLRDERGCGTAKSRGWIV